MKAAALALLSILLLGCSTALAAPTCITRSITIDKVALYSSGLTPFDFSITRNGAPFESFSLRAIDQSHKVYLAQGGLYSVTEDDYHNLGWKLVQGYPYTYCYEFGNAATHFSPESINMDIFEDVHCVFTNEAMPNAVEVSELSAISEQSGIALSWQTYSEYDILGFDILRAEVYNGSYHRINYIPSQAVGSSEGGEYSLLDTLVRRGETYYYRLMAVRADGTTEQLLDTFVTYMPVYKLWFPRGK